MPRKPRLTIEEKNQREEERVKILRQKYLAEVRASLPERRQTIEALGRKIEDVLYLLDFFDCTHNHITDEMVQTVADLSNAAPWLNVSQYIRLDREGC